MKKIFSVLLLLLLSFPLFAVPGGGPNGGGSRGEPGGMPGGGQGVGQGGGIPAKEPSPPNSEHPGEPPRPEDGSAPTRVFIKPADGRENPPEQNSESVTNFRGVKMELSEKDPAVLKTSVSQASNNRKQVVLYFNQTINSKSLVPEKILINGKPLDKTTKIKFNRRVDSCSFFVEGQGIEDIEILELKGYNGKITESVKVRL